MKTIFVVDDNSTNLLMAEEALSDHYEVITMLSASTMFEFLDNVLPDLILLDIMMPDINGLDALKQLKANKKFANIPVMFLTGKNDTDIETLGFEMGIADFIKKPFSEPVILNCIKTVLESETANSKKADVQQ